MVEIKNKGLKLFIQTTLNKNIKDVQAKDLEPFEVLSFEGENDPENPVVDFQDLAQFPNVKKIVVSDSIITRENIEQLAEKQVKAIRFNRCAFQKDDDLGELPFLESLELINSYNNGYDFLEKLPHLQLLAVVNPYTETPIELSYLAAGSTLKDVTLQSCILDDFSYLGLCKNIEYLNLLGSDVPMLALTHHFLFV